MEYTVTSIAERFEEAAHTLRRLPKVTVQGYRGYWPTTIDAFHEAYGYNDIQVRLGPPSARHITEMDECLRWLLWLSADEVKVVWGRANGIRWKTLQKRIRASRSTLSFTYRTAITKIVEILRGRCIITTLPYKAQIP